MINYAQGKFYSRKACRSNAVGGGAVYAHSYGKLKLNAKTLEFEMKVHKIAVACISSVNQLDLHFKKTVF